jgi:hypothetical protein
MANISLFSNLSPNYPNYLRIITTCCLLKVYIVFKKRQLLLAIFDLWEWEIIQYPATMSDVERTGGFCWGGLIEAGHFRLIIESAFSFSLFWLKKLRGFTDAPAPSPAIG